MTEPTRDQLPAIPDTGEDDESRNLDYWQQALTSAREKAALLDPTEAESRFDFLEDYRYEGRPLPIREKLFVSELLANKFSNPTDAYVAAGYKTSNSNQARMNAMRIMRKRRVAYALELAVRQRLMRLNINADRVLEELAKMTFANLSDVIIWDDAGNVSLRPPDEIPQHALHAVQEVTQIRNTRTGDVTTKVKMTDKLAAITAMMKHLGLMNQKIDVDLNISSSDAMTKARERVINAYKTHGIYEPDDDENSGEQR